MTRAVAMHAHLFACPPICRCNSNWHEIEPLPARTLWYHAHCGILCSRRSRGRRVTVRRQLRLAVLQVLLDVVAHGVGGGFRARRQVELRQD